MEFRDLKRQYEYLKSDIDKNIQSVINSTSFIGGEMVSHLEHDLAAYVNVKHCITCANGTDALQLALMAWGISEGDAVFLPDFTFFSTGEVVSAVGATPVFVDVRTDTFNIDINSLEEQILNVKEQGKLNPRVVIPVDLFGQPAEYDEIRRVADKEGLFVLEDGAQGFGGRINDKKTCSFGDISTTSFFPAKPLGCYGDGGAIFTDNDELAELLRSYKVHGKGINKYDNVRIGMNSRLDSIQAAVLLAKLPVFMAEEVENANSIAFKYSEELKEVVNTPVVLNLYTSSWAQYTIQLTNQETRDGLQEYLSECGIPSMVYYQKPMHRQGAFEKNGYECNDDMFSNTKQLCETVLSLPFHPYMQDDEIDIVCCNVKKYLSSV
ncbi:DegT/DnrJ/EryC1/StrS family aminotransferase [Butyrivibrio sp. NC3005]|uniref:DegT/DnrJ/EryC1/StrS family aminotransferase n=1 Tax=Butyrivibrio sp. NC3005 TaxID=1280685 RepID=UPI00041C14DA|nr:DegT/DnrJ/EryC1/StrS aminotransferase family protein [Butyrivibrio sp. NC3005]